MKTEERIEKYLNEKKVMPTNQMKSDLRNASKSILKLHDTISNWEGKHVLTDNTMRELMNLVMLMTKVENAINREKHLYY